MTNLNIGNIGEAVAKLVFIKKRDMIKLESWWTTVNKNVKKSFDSSKFDYVFAYHVPSDTYKITKSETLNGLTAKTFSLIEECEI